jgi:hypothetical protein
MSSGIADGVTRKVIEEGMPVVAFLVSRNMQYPYNKNPNEAPISPCDVFSFESLPIYGEYDGYGGVKATCAAASVAVHVARAQAGGLSWEKLMSTGVGDSYQLLGKPGEDNKRAYGLFIVHEEVFERVCGLALARVGKGVSLAEKRDQDVGIVLNLVNRFLGVCAEVPVVQSEERDLQVYHGLQIASLKTSIGHADDGSKLDMPELARIFESRAIFGDDLQLTLRELNLLSNIGRREPKPRNTDEVPFYKEMLQALWLTNEFHRGLDLLDVTVVPSKRTRSDGLQPKLHMAAAVVESLVRERLNWAIEGYGDIEDLPSLEADVKVARDMADRLEHELLGVRTELTKDYVARSQRS